MKKLTRIAAIFIVLALLFTLTFASLVMASPALIEEPSFETVVNWAYSETDANYDGAQATSAEWVTQGTYSYKFFNTKAPALNSYCQIAQSANFTSIDTLSFDANLWAEQANRFKASVFVGAAEVWTKPCPATATDYLHQEVDVSTYTGTQDLIFRITCIDTSAPFNLNDQTNYFDNIKLWGSYNDSLRTTVANNFATYGDSVYMYGENFDTTGTYKVAYYDGGTSGDGSNGAKLLTETYTDDGDGILDLSQIRPADFMSSASAGTWHAVVYKTTGTMPLTYDLVSTTSANYTVTDSFYVESTAIPEFSTIFAAIAVAGLCFGIYYWMRRRYRRQAATA